MTVLRYGVMIGALGWVLFLVDDEPTERWMFFLPVMAVLCYGVYVLYALITRRTVWIETMLLGLALLPLVVGAGLAIVAAMWGGIRWVWHRGRS